MTKKIIAERNIEGEKFLFYHLGDSKDIHIMGEENCLGYPNYISIYPKDIFGLENYGTTRHVAPWKLKELRKTYSRLKEELQAIEDAYSMLPDDDFYYIEEEGEKR